MSTLKAIQQVGIDVAFISDQQVELLIETGTSSHVKTKDRTKTLFKIEKNVEFARHRTFRTHFIDAQSERKLFDMWKEAGMDRYYAEEPGDSDRHRFDVDVKSPMMGGPTLRIDFANVAGDNRPVCLEYKVHKFKKIGKVVWQGDEIAEIEEVRLGTALRLAPGVDPLPIIAMLVALRDKILKSSSVTFGPGASGTGDGLTGGRVRIGGVI